MYGRAPYHPTMLTLAALLLAAPPPPAAAAPGPLLLVGGAALPDDVRREFVRLAGGPKAVILVVPTASQLADDPAERDGFLRPWRDLKPVSAELLHTRDRAAADSEAFAKPVAAATAVWFSGGDQRRLTDTYRGTRFHRELLALAARGGAVGGTSAGAMALTDVMNAGGDPATSRPGLGLLAGFVVDTHFSPGKRKPPASRLPRLLALLEKHPGHVGLGLDESTALLVRGRTATVMGAAAATACWPKAGDRPERVEAKRAGETFDLPELRRVAAGRAGE